MNTVIFEFLGDMHQLNYEGDELPMGDMHLKINEGRWPDETYTEKEFVELYSVISIIIGK